MRQCDNARTPAVVSSGPRRSGADQGLGGASERATEKCSAREVDKTRGCPRSEDEDGRWQWSGSEQASEVSKVWVKQLENPQTQTQESGLALPFLPSPSARAVHRRFVHDDRYL